MIRNKSLYIFFAIIILSLSACQTIGLVEPTATPLPPTPTPVPPTELTICMSSEPETLYPYALTSQSAGDILQTIYEGPFDEVNGVVTPVILSSMPDYNSGSASFAVVNVQTGDRVVNIYGEIISLQAGAQIFPSGCNDSSCSITWDGIAAIQMDQPTVNYQLVSGLTWSDGQPLTAADSVYSYELVLNADTPSDKTNVNFTFSYTALDETTVQWIGLPGLVTDAFEDYFWMPLPQHIWSAYSAADLLSSDAATRSPLGWGPYVMDEWAPGAFIRLKKNELYFRASEGLPKYDYITFQFIPQGDIATATNGTCDIVSEDVLDINQLTMDEGALSSAGYNLVVSDSTEFEFLAFGINPASYDDTYYPYGTDRPDIFGDVRVRQAIALCIDRQGILDELTGSLVDASDTYLTADSTLLSGLALNQYGYDPEQGKALLNEVGWQDYDLNPDTPLTMIAVDTTVPFGTNFSINLYTSQSQLRGLIAQKIASNLAECGIEVVVNQQSIQELYQPGPDGVIFGRNFDLALLSMDLGTDPYCQLFSSEEIPTEDNNWIGTITGGSNFMGYTSTTYDEVCKLANSAGLDSGAYIAGIQNTLQVLSADLPFIPFYHHPDITLIKQDLNLSEDLTTLEKILFSIEIISPNIN